MHVLLAFIRAKQLLQAAQHVAGSHHGRLCHHRERRIAEQVNVVRVSRGHGEQHVGRVLFNCERRLRIVGSELQYVARLVRVESGDWNVAYEALSAGVLAGEP